MRIEKRDALKTSASFGLDKQDHYNIQHVMIKKTREYLEEKESSFAGKLSKSDAELIFEFIIHLLNNEYKMALENFLDIKDKSFLEKFLYRFRYFKRVDIKDLKEDEEAGGVFLLLELVTALFIHLLSERQYHYILKLFEENRCDLKSLFKPIYYSLMVFMKSSFPDEHRKIAGELKQTVDEIVEEVNLLAIYSP
jgi:hypothetical protein